MIKPFAYLGFAFCGMLVFLPLSCKKEPEKIDQAAVDALQLKKDAEFNNSIIPGAGNLLTEKFLVANSRSQLVAKLGYNKDTLAYFGNVNAAGQLVRLHTVVFSQKGNSELYVTEIFPELKAIRKYSILNGVRSKFVEIIERLNGTDFTVTIQDYNWATGEYRTLESLLISNDTKVGEFSGSRVSDDGLCPDPAPSENWTEKWDNLMNDFNCWAQAGKGHLINWGTPIWEGLGKKVLSAKQEFDRIIEQRKNEEAARSATDSNLADLTSKEEKLRGDLKDLEAKYEDLKDERNNIPSMIFIPDLSDTNFDENTDEKVRLTYYVGNSSGKPYSKVAYLKLQINKGTESLLTALKGSNPVDGYVTFDFNPLTLPNYQKLKTVTAKCQIANVVAEGDERAVQLKLLLPPVVSTSGVSSILPTSAVAGGRITDDGGLTITEKGVCYDKSPNPTIGNMKAVSTDELNEYQVALSGLTTNTKYYVRAYAINAKGLSYGEPQPFSTAFVDSLKLYTESAIGKYKVTSITGTGIGDTYCELKAGGYSVYTVYNNPSWPDGTKFPEDWHIERVGGKYYFLSSISNPDYQLGIAEPISYPVKQFVYGSNYVKE